MRSARAHIGAGCFRIDARSDLRILISGALVEVKPHCIGGLGPDTLPLGQWLAAKRTELCLILGDATGSGGAGFGGIVHGDAVGELDAFNDLRQLIPPVQPPPGL